MLVIGTLLALGRFDELRMHVRSAIEEDGCLSWTRSKKCSCSRRSTASALLPAYGFRVLREVVEGRQR